MPRPHVQVILAEDAVPDGLRVALDRIGATTSFWPLAEALRTDAMTTADAVVVVVPHDMSGLAGPLRVLFDRLAERPRATLILSPCGQTVRSLEHPPTVPVSFGDALDERALTIRLGTMIDMRDSLDSLHRGLVANRRSGENMAKRYLNQLRLASQVQREFLPETLPPFGRISFHVLFRPVDYVSGDIYDVHRLDEDHIGIALADASGHGIPAALLTVYIKRALRGKEIENGTYRILSPDEVLGRLNDDILDAHLTECPFVAAVYAVLNTRTLRVSFARGGAPYPLHRSATRELRVLRTGGGVVGVLPSARFQVCEMQLSPGDSLLLYSDGLERIVAPQCAAQDAPPEFLQAVRRATGAEPALAAAVAANDARSSHGPFHALATAVLDDEPSVPSRLSEAGSSACARRRSSPCFLSAGAAALPCDEAGPQHAAGSGDVSQSSWCATLRDDGPDIALKQIAGRQRALRRMGYPLDDLTVLAMQVAD